MKTTLRLLYLALLFTLLKIPALQANEQLVIAVNFAVRVPPCTINAGQVINIAFGDSLWLDKIDGTHYRQPINYQVKCVDTPLRMAITGESAGFNYQVLKTSQDNLGIKILSNGSALSLDEWRNFSLSAPPRLEVVLVQRPGVKLQAGKFTASALLKVEYL